MEICMLSIVNFGHSFTFYLPSLGGYEFNVYPVTLTTDHERIRMNL